MIALRKVTLQPSPFLLEICFLIIFIINYKNISISKYLSIFFFFFKQFVPSEMKDEKYWHRRKKNNIAAKRSRDARRMKENQIAIRASYLERENDLLRKQLDDFKRETKLLKIKLTRYESMAQQQQQQPGLLDLSTIDDSK
jgi:hypothetical protein